MPPITNVTMKLTVHNIGVSKRMRPRYIVNSQLKIFAPVGIEMIIVVIPKNAFTLAPAPIVKKWCSQTRYDRIVITTVAYTIEVYPNRRLPENVETTSDQIPNAGRTRMYTSGWPQIQIRLTYIIWLPPRSLVKKWVPKYRSSDSSANVAVSTGNAATIRMFVHS